MGETFSIGMAGQAIRAGDAHRRFFPDPSDSRIPAFKALNGLENEAAVISPGRILVVPHAATLGASGERQLRSVSACAAKRSPVTMAPAQAAGFNQGFDLLDAMTRHETAITFVGGELDGVSTYFQTRISLIERDLERLDDAYRRALRAGLRLGSPEAKAMRAPVEAALQRQINGFSTRAIMANPGRSSVKKALGISHKSLAKSFALDGSAMEVKQIEDAVTRSSRFASRLKPLGTAGRILNAGQVAAEATIAYREEGARGVVDVAAREAVSFGAGRLGASAAVSCAVLLGVSTGGVGFVVLGLAAVVGGIAGSTAGKVAYEAATSDEVAGWIVRATD